MQIQRLTKLLLCLLWFAAGGTSSQSQTIRFQGGPTRTALLELYTSEGCSSCPPAEAWLSRLQTSPGLWKDFAPVAFHVDYWDYLGWKDAWADAAFAGRQRAYAQLWHREDIYTPEFVLAGQEWHHWFTGSNGPQSGGDQAGVLVASSTDTNLWQASYAPAGTPEARYEIHAALLAGGLVSDVKAGENKGRRLNHDFVAVNLVEAGMTAGDQVARGKFILDTPRFNCGKTLALTVWVTRAGELEPLQATGGWLVPPPVK
jgi:hypothetical protein